MMKAGLVGKSLRALACAVLMAAGTAGAADKTVFGIEVGSAFRVPQCDAREGVTYTKRLCFNAAATQRDASGADRYEVSLPRADTPSYVRGALAVYVVNGNVASVEVNTWGFEAQHNAYAALQEKYGAPTRARQERRNRLRSRFPVQFAEWEFDDFGVEFVGSTGSIDWGKIVVSANRYAERTGGRHKGAGQGGDRRLAVGE